MAMATRTSRKICGGNLNGSIMPDFVFYFSERRGLPFPIADPATLVCKSRQFLFLQTADVGDQRLDFVARQGSIRPGDKRLHLRLAVRILDAIGDGFRSEEHTSELQSLRHL